MRVVLSGGWSYGNIGDEVIAKAMIYLIEKTFPKAEFIISSYNPNDFSYHHNRESIKSVHRVFEDNKYDYINSLDKIVKEPGKYDLQDYASLFDSDTLFIMGGGGYFDSRWESQFYARLCEIFIAKNRGSKVVLVGQSIGPIVSDKDKEMAKKAFDVCDYICTRDKDSKVLIDSITKNNKAEVGADAAVIISDILPRSEEDKSLKVVNMMLQNFAYHVKADCKFVIPYDKIVKRLTLVMYVYRYKIRKIIKHVVNIPRVHINFVLSVQNTDKSDNQHYMKFLNEILKGISKDSYSIITSIPVDEFCKYLSKGNLMVSVKMHPLVVSSSYEVNTLAISQHYKIEEYMEMLGRTEYCYKNTNIRLKEIFRQIDNCIEDDYKQDSNINDLKKQVYDTFIKIKKISISNL